VLLQMTLATLVGACAPTVSPQTELAIIQVESAGKPWTINDNTGHRAYVLSSRAAAIGKARELLRMGHNLDLGLAQLNTIHLREFGLDAAQAFEPCTNIWAGSVVLKRAYAAAVARFGPGELALYHAFQIYNSGSPNGATHYAAAVWQAGSLQTVDAKTGRSS
jgi:type IV secretion system protein VirB1